MNPTEATITPLFHETGSWYDRFPERTSLKLLVSGTTKKHRSFWAPGFIYWGEHLEGGSLEKVAGVERTDLVSRGQGKGSPGRRMRKREHMVALIRTWRNTSENKGDAVIQARAHIECHQPLHKLTCRVYGEMAHFSDCSWERDLESLSRWSGDGINMEKVPMKRRKGECPEISSDGNLVLNVFLWPAVI